MGENLQKYVVSTFWTMVDDEIRVWDRFRPIFQKSFKSPLVGLKYVDFPLVFLLILRAVTLTSVSSEAKFELQRYYGGILPRLGTLEQTNNEPLKKFQNFGIQNRLTCSSANQRLQILKAFTPEIRQSWAPQK